jgi:hypothetical protein
VDFQGRVRMMEASMGESHMHRVYPHRLSLCIVILGLFPHSQVEGAQSSAFELPSVNALQSKFLLSVDTDVCRCSVNITSYAHRSAACL